MPNDLSQWEVVNDNTSMPSSGQSPDLSGWEVVPNNSNGALGVSPAMPASSSYKVTPSMISNITGATRNPLDAIQDFGAGLVANLGRGGNDIASALTGGYAPSVNWNQIQNTLASSNKSMGGNALQGAGGVLPYTVAGGPIGAGVGAVIQDPSHPISSFMLNALPIGAIGKMTGVFDKAVQPEIQPFVHPDEIAQSVHGDVIGNRSVQQSTKNVAREIKENYDRIKSERQDDYDAIFNKPTDETSYATGEPVKAKDLGLIDNKYYQKYDDYKFPDENVQNLHNAFMDNPTVDTAHKLQSEIGSEVGYLSKQRDKGILDDAGKNKLNNYVQMRKTLLDDINDRFSETDPNLADSYMNATQNWARDVIPYHSDKTLKDIAQGRIVNPTKDNIKSIFSFPEQNINKVAGDLSQEGRNNIAHIGMNVNRYQNTAKDLVRGHNNLESNGMESYLSPSDDQSIRVMRGNVFMQKAKDEADKVAAKNALAQPPGFGSKAWQYAKSLGLLASLSGANALIHKATGINPEFVTNAALEANALRGVANK